MTRPAYAGPLPTLVALTLFLAMLLAWSAIIATA